MKRNVLLTIIAFFAISIVNLGCSKAEKNEIQIGVILPLSGSLVSYGKTTLNGIKLSVEQINKKGGIDGKKIVLLIEDNKGDSTESRNAYKKLASSNQVIAVIGPITSTNLKSIRRDAQTIKVPVISPTATNDKLTIGNPYIFRACFNDSFQGEVIANYASKNYKKAAVIIDMNSDYSKGLSKSFKNAFTNSGGVIVSEEGYQQKDIEFGLQLKKVKSSGAEVVFIPGYPPELPLIIEQAKTIGLKAKLCGADGWDNDTVINQSGANILGCFLVGAFSLEDKRDIVTNFVKEFQKSNNNATPGTFEALGYDSVLMLEEGLKNKNLSLEKSLLQIKNLEAVTGNITITKDGDAIKNAIIFDIVKDKKEDKYIKNFKEIIKSK